MSHARKNNATGEVHDTPREGEEPAAQGEPRPTNRDLRIALPLFAFLTILVWGVFALDRGMFQDDMLSLSQTSAHGDFWHRCFFPVTTPTRIFAAVPYAVALLTRFPFEFLQLVYGVVWFFSGLLGYGVLRLLFPRERLLAFLGGSMTLCATSDFLTDSLVALHYQVSAAAYFASLYCLLRYWKNRGTPWLLLAALFLSWSIWTTDTAFAPVILTPLVLWAWDEFRVSRRLLLTSALWYAVFIPYLYAFVKFLRDPRSYAARALIPMTLTSRLGRVWHLVVHNFDPWSWGPARINRFAGPPSVIPRLLALSLSALGTLAFLAAYRQLRKNGGQDGDSRERPSWIFLFGALSLMMVVASNSTYAMVRSSEAFYRTHITSRYWASFALALASVAMTRIRRLRWAGFALPVVFIGLGLYGGLNRQDYYLGSWLRHRRELRSLTDAVPDIEKGTSLVLYAPAHRRYMATHVTYLARSWTSFLFEQPKLRTRVYLWSSGKADCSLNGDRLACRDVTGEPDFTAPIARAVVLWYCTAANRYELADGKKLSGLLGVDSVAGYDPERLIRRKMTERTREALYAPTWLARYLPALAERPESSAVGAPIRDSASCAAARLSGSVEVVSGQKPADGTWSVPRGPWQISGWAAVTSPAGVAVDSVIVSLDDKLIGSATLDAPRLDPSPAPGSNALLKTAWILQLADSPAPDSGPHRLSVSIRSTGGSDQRLDAGSIAFR